MAWALAGFTKGALQVPQRMSLFLAFSALAQGFSLCISPDKPTQ